MIMKGSQNHEVLLSIPARERELGGKTHECPVGSIKYKQACTRLSTIFCRLTRFSCSR